MCDTQASKDTRVGFEEKICFVALEATSRRSWIDPGDDILAHSDENEATFKNPRINGGRRAPNGSELPCRALNGGGGVY